MNKEIIDRINKFNKDRDWDKFHSPVNLAKSITLEAAELLEEFQWNDDNFSLDNVAEELADVMIYCIQMTEKLELDIDKIIMDKIDKNEEKYPVNLYKSRSPQNKRNFFNYC